MSMDVRPTIRLVAKSEAELAYDRYLEVYAWLNAKGIRQWLRPVSKESFQERQARDELFGCFVAGELAVVVTLVFEVSEYWVYETGESRNWWIKSLAVTPRFRGARIGVYTMSECERLVVRAGGSEVFLDCVDGGFLPAYYSKLGYVELARKNITYPSGNSFLMALMRKGWPNCSLNSDAAPSACTGGPNFCSP